MDSAFGKVQQLNLHHCEAAAAEVGEISDSIYLLQEPYYHTNGRPDVRKPENFYSNAESRAAIYTSSLQSFSFVPMHEFIDDDIAAGIIEGGCLKYPIVVASIYLDINYTTPILPKMMELVEFCTARRMRLLCGIDCNAHSSLWGCADTNSRGEQLEEFIFEHKLFVHNVGNEVTYCVPARRASSIIDITVTLNMEEEEIQGWHVSPRVTFSDHKMISYTVGKSPTTKIWSRNYGKAKWPLFKENISANLGDTPQLWSESIVDDSLVHFYEVVEKALNISCPRHRVRKKDSLIWWNQECDNAKGHYLSLAKKVRKNYDPLLAIELNAARLKYRYIIKKAKRDSFRELVQETNSVPAMSKLNKILDKKEAGKLGFLTRNNGTTTCSTEETLQHMFEEHFPGSEPCSEHAHLPGSEPCSEHDIDIRSNKEGDPRPIDRVEWINNFNIKVAIEHFKPDKAAGPDGLKPKVLKQLPEAAIEFLKCIYTACIEMGYTPSKWCHCRVLFLPKPGKKSYKLARSFRPICLSSFLFKTLERLALWRVEQKTLIERPLHFRQFAYQKNMSTEHALTGSVNIIEKAYYRNRMVIVIDLDIKGAFDNVSTQAVIKAMEKKKVEQNITDWYGDYLQNRTCQSTLGGSTKIVKLNKGCPQGGVASPIIAWCFPYDPLLETYDGSAVEQFGFADDSKLIIVGLDFGTMFQTAQWAIKVAEKWAAEIEVQFSPEKTSVLFFNKGQFRPLAETRLKLYGQPINWSRDNKYLGITIDDGLTFKPHIDRVIAAAKRKLMILGKVVRNTWGPHPKAIKWAYTGIIRPALIYGAIVWANAAQSETYKSKLSTLQRLALRHIAPTRKSTPQAALDLLYDVMPLHLYIKEHAMKSALRIGIKPTWFSFVEKGHQELLYESLPIEIRGVKVDNMVTNLILAQNYEVKIGKGNDLEQLREWACYTDGSRIGNKAGSGAIILHHGQTYKHISFFMGDSSVFQAEVSAILESVKILQGIGITNSNIDILVDSQAALNAINNPITSSDLVRTTKYFLNDLGGANDIKLHWIRAHKGFKYNEIADRNANKGLEEIPIPENIPAPSKRSIYSVVEDVSLQKWTRQWENNPECRQSKYFIHGPSKRRAEHLLRHSKDVLGRMVRFLTGHAFLRRQNAIVFHGVNPPPGDVSCRFCEDWQMDETPHHLIVECEALCHWRSATMGGFILDEFPEWDVASIANFLSHKELILIETEN